MRRGAAALALIWTLGTGCVGVLGVAEDDHDSVVAAMCRCDQLESISVLGHDCGDYIDNRLRNASEGTREAWMKRFVEDGCDSCANVDACIYAEPICSKKICQEDRDCCGFPDGEKCVAKVCK